MNDTIARLGRRLRLGVVGGGPGSFIGPVHRTAARLDDCYEIAASVLSSDPARAKAGAEAAGLDPARAYGSVPEMLDAEADREDGIEVLAVMTPNDSHYPLSRLGLERGLDVICDKPLTNTPEDALDLAARVRDSRLVFCTTYNYTGYPMVRQARAMIDDGDIGEVRMVQVEYIQPSLATLTEAEKTGAEGPWRLDPARSGPSLVLGDIGSHAHHMACFVTGLQVESVSARVGAVVPGRQVHDCVMANLEYEGGAWGTLWVTNAAAGAEHGLRFRIFGSTGGLEWFQENPNYLHHMPLGGPRRTLARGGAGLKPAAVQASRLKIGHPEGYQEAFATLYREVAAAVVARRVDGSYAPETWAFPTVEDGARGVKFIEAALKSSAQGGAWADARIAF